ncbi:MAG: hypothetical protein ACJ76Z_07820 [Thermoleophilaceae bacterium]
MRLAFVGQATYFDYCALEEPAAGVEPRFFDFRAGGDPEPLAAALRAWRPDVVLAFRPEILPPGALAGIDAVRCGFLTEPLPRPGSPSHPDLDRRLADLERLDPSNVDRIVAFDPLIAATVERIAPVWRALPLPVADRHFAPVAAARSDRRSLFTGRSTDHRERLLAPAKHLFRLAHLAHGVTDRHLIEFLRESDVGINLHNEDYPTFENRVCVYLAAGLLLLSEPLSPAHGLVPGTDYLEIETPDELQSAMTAFEEDADAFRPLRLSGRRKAERWRASFVYPRLARDLVADVQLFGRSLPNAARSR